MMWTDNPLADFHRWDAEQQAELDKRPVCADCGEPIQDDHFYLTSDGKICPDCLESNYRKNTEDFIDSEGW